MLIMMQTQFATTTGNLTHNVIPRETNQHLTTCTVQTLCSEKSKSLFKSMKLPTQLLAGW